MKREHPGGSEVSWLMMVIGSTLVAYGFSNIDIVVTGVYPLNALTPFAWALPFLIIPYFLEKRHYG